jgi:hypothetical protein
MELCAFNYQTQKWITGEEARPHLIYQLRAEIEVCKSKDGLRYFRNLGSEEQGSPGLPLEKRLRAYISNLEQQLAGLK